MKVKDFIKMLQELDPEDHVRIPGGAIWCSEPKPGYWDGPYEYIDGDTFVISTRGSKVDIRTLDVEDWIWDHDGDYSKIKLDLAGYSGETLERQLKDYQDRFAKISQECKEFDKHHQAEAVFEVIQLLQEGWKIREDKSHGSWSKSMMDLVKGLKTNRMNMGQCQAVYKSGIFESYDENEKFIFWRLK
jgi:hypothetical protein